MGAQGPSSKRTIIKSVSYHKLLWQITSLPSPRTQHHLKIIPLLIFKQSQKHSKLGSNVCICFEAPAGWYLLQFEEWPGKNTSISERASSRFVKVKPNAENHWQTVVCILLHLQKQEHCTQFPFTWTTRTTHTNAQRQRTCDDFYFSLFFFWKCTCCTRFQNDHVWLQHGCAGRTRWALASTTKAGFKPYSRSSRRKPRCPPTDTSLNRPDVFRGTRVQLMINSSTWSTSGRRNKHGRASGKLLEIQ